MHRTWYDRTCRRVRDLASADQRVFLEVEVRRVACRNCGSVKREQLAFLADNIHFTKRFAHYVGRRCRDAAIKAIADELQLDWHSVKELDKQYMRAQLARAGRPGPEAIGIDEISIRKRHTYRIVVSDLIRKRPIWFGGADRSEASMAQFYAWLGERKTKGIRLVVMDMWKPFRKATQAHAPQAAILFDKFHVLRHLADALDTVRKSEYARLSGNDRRFIKGQPEVGASRRSTRSCPTGRISPSMAVRRSRRCWPPTNGSTRRTCSKNHSASSGATGVKPGPGASSITGAPA